MDEAKGQGNIVYPVSKRCLSYLLHFNHTNHSWDRVFGLEETHLKFWKKAQKSVQWNVTKIKSRNTHD